MPSKQLTDLCRILLKDIYGDLASQVVGVLFDRGRLSCKELARYTNLPVTTIQRTLIALIQNRFVLFWTEEPGHSKRPAVTYYISNWPEIYAVLWTGSTLDQVAELFSSKSNQNRRGMALEITKNMHVYGHMKTGDYLDSHSNYNEEEKAALVTTFTELVGSKLLTPLHDYDFFPNNDMYQKFLGEQKIKVAQASAGLSESAKLAQAVQAATTQVNELKAQKHDKHAGLVKRDDLLTNGNGVKIPFNSKKGYGSKNAVSIADEYTADKDSVVAMSHGKFLLLARNKELVDFCSRRIGKVTAKVYAAVLKCYDSRVHECKQKVFASDEFNISAIEVAQRLEKGTDLVSVFPKKKSKKRKRSKKKSKRKKIKTEHGGVVSLDSDSESESESSDSSDSELDSDSDSDSDRGSSHAKNEALNNHLEILSNSVIPFLRRPPGSRGEYFVPFAELMEVVRQYAYDDIVEKKFGQLAVRILRVVREKQKVSETFLSTVALLNTVELRKYTSKMEAAGCLDIQEVARSADRAPSRTYYFWYHKAPRAYSLILEDLYKSMANLYTRLLAEQNTNSILLAKLQREDVKGNEDAYLSTQEKMELAELRRREEKIMVQMMRLDQLVRVFRDY